MNWRDILTAIAETVALLSMFAVFYFLLILAPEIDAAIIEWKAGN